MRSLRCAALLLLSPSAFAAGPEPLVDEGVHVCVEPSGLLKYRPDEPCPPGQKRFKLAQVEAGVNPDDADDKLQKQLEALTQRVKALEAEKKELASKGNAPAPTGITRVFAPFEVTDRAGTVFLRVTDQSINNDSSARVSIGRGTSDNFSLIFRNAAGQQISLIGETAERYGVVAAYDKSGSVRAVVHGQDGVSLYNNSAAHAATLGLGAQGGGHLRLNNPSGVGVVEAGTLDDGTGTVRAGPQFKCAPAGQFGLPDCLKGRKGK
jgi:hypothetical protein